MIYEAVFSALNGDDRIIADSPNSTASAVLGTPLPTDISSLIAFALSLGALRDWIKIFLLGGLLESARRFFTYLYAALWEAFLLTVEIGDEDQAHAWVILWLSKQDRWAGARSVELSSRKSGRGHNNINEYPTTSGKDISLAPTAGTTHTLWYQGRLMRVTRTKQQLGNGVVERTLVLSIYSRRHGVIEELIQEAKKHYEDEITSRICIYVADQYQNFYMAGTRPKRDMESVIIPPRMKQFLLADAEDFLGSEAWYSQRGIPWQRGYLLFGTPGAGKTSIIQALAGHFGLDIYVISLSRRGLDDTSLVDMINDVPERSIILMEDIDAAFTRSVNRDASTEGSGGTSPDSPTSGPPTVSPSSITLSGLLNAIDGVQAQPGRILFATTNKKDALDPALIRPGRLDVHLEFRKASRWQAEQLFIKFYPSDGHYVDHGDDTEDVDMEEFGDIDGKTDSGSTPSSSSTRVSTPLPASFPHLKKLSAQDAPGHPTDIPVLAKEFAALVPPYSVSMAALQGHLMMYKTQPGMAVRRTEAFLTNQGEESRVTGKTPGFVADAAPPATAPAPAPAPVPMLNPSPLMDVSAAPPSN